MSKVSNVIMLFVNGVTIILMGYFLEYIMAVFPIKHVLPQVFLGVGALVILLPMIVKIDVYDEYKKEESGMLFWKKKHTKTLTYKEVSILGLFPINRTRISSSAGYHTVLDNEALEVVTAFLPVVNSYIDLSRNVRRLR